MYLTIRQIYSIKFFQIDRSAENAIPYLNYTVLAIFQIRGQE